MKTGGKTRSTGKKVKGTGSRTADYLKWDTAKWLIRQLYEDGDYYYCMILTIGIYFGLRVSDMRQIKWRDIIDNERITLYEKKTGKMASFPVNVHIRNLAINIRPKIKNQSHYIIHTKKTWTINEKLRRCKEKYNLDIEHFSTHTFRKTFGRHYMEMKGFSAKALLYLNYKFNHSSIEMTKQYLGITKQEIDEVYNDVADDPVFV